MLWRCCFTPPLRSLPQVGPNGAEGPDGGEFWAVDVAFEDAVLLRITEVEQRHNGVRVHDGTLLNMALEVPLKYSGSLGL